MKALLPVFTEVPEVNHIPNDLPQAAEIQLHPMFNL